MKNIPVVIFCGGYGSRLREKTRYKPKTMVEVGGMPLIWHLMKIYQHHGFNDFILTLGYRGDYIRKFLAENEHLFADFNITLADTGESTATGGRLLRVAKHINNDTFMCTYGDGLSDIDLTRLLKFHRGFNDVIATITGVFVPHTFGIISITKEGKLISYQKGHRMEKPINAGFMILEKDYLNYLDDSMMIEEPFNVLASEGKQAVYLHDGYFSAIDTYKDLDVMNKAWEEGSPWKTWND